MSDKPRSDSSPSQLRHELRTPLNQIIGYTQMLLEQAEEDGRPEYVGDLQKIEKAGQRLVSLVDVLVNSLTTHTSAALTAEMPLASIPGGIALGVAAGPLEGGRLLVVDDNEMNRDMLARRLKRKGHDVLVAVDGGEGVAMAHSDRPDLILMDMSLPVLDGWEATRRLKSASETSAIPIIALTAHAMSTDREQAFAAGCDDYDTKPVEFAGLLAKIDALLARGHAS